MTGWSRCSRSDHVDRKSASTCWRKALSALAFALDESRPGGKVVLVAHSQENRLGAFRVYRHEIVLQWGLFFHATFLAGAVERSRKKMGRFKRG